mmetsp:Transcript_166195/g.533531  ORF Transcript_166195/g.533531 Transcript_166195/m.533531 type:complete len:274 (-) Transcript_166195:223-1044(-)
MQCDVLCEGVEEDRDGDLNLGIGPQQVGCHLWREVAPKLALHGVLAKDSEELLVADVQRCIRPDGVGDTLPIELPDVLNRTGGEHVEERRVGVLGLRKGPYEVGDRVRWELGAGHGCGGQLPEEDPLRHARFREGPGGHRDVDEAPGSTDLLRRLLGERNPQLLSLLLDLELCQDPSQLRCVRWPEVSDPLFGCLQDFHDKLVVTPTAYPGQSIGEHGQTSRLQPRDGPVHPVLQLQPRGVLAAVAEVLVTGHLRDLRDRDDHIASIESGKLP